MDDNLKKVLQRMHTQFTEGIADVDGVVGGLYAKEVITANLKQRIVSIKHISGLSLLLGYDSTDAFMYTKAGPVDLTVDSQLLVEHFFVFEVSLCYKMVASSSGRKMI